MTYVIPWSNGTRLPESFDDYVRSKDTRPMEDKLVAEACRYLPGPTVFEPLRYTGTFKLPPIAGTDVVRLAHAEIDGILEGVQLPKLHTELHWGWGNVSFEHIHSASSIVANSYYNTLLSFQGGEFCFYFSNHYVKYRTSGNSAFWLEPFPPLLWLFLVAMVFFEQVVVPRSPEPALHASIMRLILTISLKRWVIRFQLNWKETALLCRV